MVVVIVVNGRRTARTASCCSVPVQRIPPITAGDSEILTAHVARGYARVAIFGRVL